MPGKNGTGPRGGGPMTGGGLGYCVADGSGQATSLGQGRGRGCRGGRGLGRGMNRGMGGNAGPTRTPPTPEAASSMAPQEYLEWLEAEMRRTREALSREG